MADGVFPQASNLTPQASPGFLAHSFRLRDPWQCDSTADGGLRWSRVFHRPTGLEPDDQLILVLTGAPPTAQVTVNGRQFTTTQASGEPHPACATGILPVPAADTSAPSSTGGSRIPQAPPMQYDLTRILADDNRIELVIPPQASGLRPQASSPFPYDARLAIIGHS